MDVRRFFKVGNNPCRHPKGDGVGRKEGERGGPVATCVAYWHFTLRSVAREVSDSCADVVLVNSPVIWRQALALRTSGIPFSFLAGRPFFPPIPSQPIFVGRKEFLPI